MTTAAALSTTELVERLLGLQDADARRELIEHCRLGPAELHDAVLLLVEEALRLLGANPSRALSVCSNAIALADCAGDPFLQAMARMRHADALRTQRRDAEACALYDEAAASFRRLGRPVEAARTRIGWVDSASQLGRHGEALAALRRARRVFIGHGETAALARLSNNAGMAELDHGHYPAALRLCGAAIRLFQSLGEAGESGLGHSHLNHGLALARAGRHREARGELELARAICERIGETAMALRVTRSLGEVEMELGRYSAALRAFESARSVHRSLGVPLGPALARDAATCYLSLNRPLDALAVVADAEKDQHGPGTPLEAIALASRRAAAHLLLGQREQAGAVLDEAGRRFPLGAVQHRAWLAVQRAGLLAAERDPIEVLAAAQHAQNLARSAGMRRLHAESLIIEGVAELARGNTDRAIRAASRARRLARAAGAPPLLRRVYELLGRTAEAEGRRGPACRRYAEAIRQLEREQSGVIFEFRDTFAEDRMGAYERLACLQLEAGHAHEALATVERSKSRALADAISGKVELRPRGTPEARRLVRELAKAREDYAAACAEARRAEGSENAARRDGAGTATRLAALERRVTGLLQRLQIAGGSEGFAELYGAQPSVPLPRLDGGAALIEFFISGADILRFRLDASGVRGVRLAGALPETERLLQAFRLNLEAAERAGEDGRGRLAAQSRAVLQRLHTGLLGGLEEVEAYRSLVIVPHGLLHQVPFHALHDGEGYLVERCAMSYAPSATLYSACLARRRPRSGSALILAYSDGGRLPSAVSEAAAVGEVLRGAMHVEEHATRGVLERAGRGASLVHIAAHARFRPDAPLFSAIELADGPLTTADVFNLDLRARLVTLSACETARSVIGGGDELVGLTRAFLYAGAASLLVSQWRVDDDATARLMTHFYSELRQGATSAEALRLAQVGSICSDTAQNRPVHPFYWAGFQIVGDGGSL